MVCAQQPPGSILMDFELEDRLIVEQAARTRTTIQEAPRIVTVITQKEIRDRGYRTINDVLRSIPGFEGDRIGFNGWFRDPMTRGNAGTSLVLLDGVNIVDPTRNMVALDRKIPLDIVKRVEVTSGPGGVLWGSNALLGVINIITHSGDSHRGGEVRAGAGEGPGANGSLRAHTSFGGAWLDGELTAFLSATWYTTRGPTLTVTQQKLLGPFAAPAPDGLTLVAEGETLAEPFDRDHFVNISGQAAFGPLSLGFLTGFEREHREIATSGGALSAPPHGAELVGSAEGLVAQGSDQLHMARLRYSDRFLRQDVGVNAAAWFVQWQGVERPFGIFPRSTLLPRGGTTALESDGTHRIGLNVDVDWLLPTENHLLVGIEGFVERSTDVVSTYFHPLLGPDAAPKDCAAEGFEYAPQRDAERPCSVRETALSGSQRFIGAAYAHDEWKLNSRLAMNAGVRSQFATTYDPTVLLSGGLVVGITDAVFFKANYSDGFRPPDFQSTAETQGIAAGVTFEANPNLDVERSRSVETEINARLFENRWPIKQLYLRGDYSFTRLDNLITFPAGRFENSGEREIHSVELLSKLLFYGDHELWLSYYFVDVVDSESGRLRNIANHVLNAGGRVSFFDGHLHLMSVLTVRGSMEDLNRTAALPWPTGGPLEVEGAAWVGPTALEVTEIPTATLWRIGVEGRGLFGDMVDVGAWVYNVLDVRWSDPDLFFDDRVLSQPQPRERWSFFGEVAIRW